MNRHEMIIQEYNKNRYLEHLSRQDLEDRVKDIFVNLLRFNGEGKIIPHAMSDGGGYWMAVFTHALEEMKIRFGAYPAGFTSGFIQQAPVPNPALDIAKKSASFSKMLDLSNQKIFFKMGQYEHLYDLLHNGVLRVAPASYYSDSSLNPAIRDDELTITTYPSNKAMPIMGYEPPKSEFEGLEVFSIEAKSPTNYYVFCCSAKFNPRLPVDFSANAVLVIRDVLGFSKKLSEAMKIHLPSWVSGLGAVTYIDPLLPRSKKPVALFCKHFKYAYQNEIRFLWLPPSPIMDLSPIFLKMGSLLEYCELYDLRGN